MAYAGLKDRVVRFLSGPRGALANTRRAIRRSGIEGLFKYLVIARPRTTQLDGGGSMASLCGYFLQPFELGSLILGRLATAGHEDLAYRSGADTQAY